MIWKLSGTRGRQSGYAVSADSASVGNHQNFSTSSGSVSWDVRAGGPPRRTNRLCTSGLVSQLMNSQAASAFALWALMPRTQPPRGGTGVIPSFAGTTAVANLSATCDRLGSISSGVRTDQAEIIATLPEANAWTRSSHAMFNAPSGSYWSMSLNRLATSTPSGESIIGVMSAYGSSLPGKLLSNGLPPKFQMYSNHAWPTGAPLALFMATP